MNDSEAIVHRALIHWAATCQEEGELEEAKLANDFADELAKGELALVVQVRVLGGIVRQESQHVQMPRSLDRFDVV